MTKEERIEMLALMQEAVKPIIEPIIERLDRLEEGQSRLEERQSKLEEGLHKLNIKIENETDRSIKTLAEGHEILNRRMDEVMNLGGRVGNLEDKVFALEVAYKETE